MVKIQESLMHSTCLADRCAGHRVKYASSIGCEWQRLFTDKLDILNNCNILDDVKSIGGSAWQHPRVSGFTLCQSCTAACLCILQMAVKA